MKRVILITLFIIVIATCTVKHWGGNSNVPEEQTVRKNESVSAVVNRPAGKTVVAPRGYSDLTGENARVEQRTIRSNTDTGQFGDGTGHPENPANDGNTAQIDNEPAIQEGPAESDSYLSEDRTAGPDTGGMEEPENSEPMPELVEPESSDEARHKGPMENELICLGNWLITFYCPCEACCGPWATGYTASGAPAIEWHTIATDQFDFGTEIYIDGLGYFVVEDRGVTGEAIDVFVNDHQYALDLGEQHRDVYLVQGG